MWSGKLPDINGKSATDRRIQIFDALLKKIYLERFGLKPNEVDDLPEIIRTIWDHVVKEEAEKAKVDKNKG